MILGVLPSITATAELVVPKWIRVKRCLDDAIRDLKLLTQINTDDLALHLLALRGVPSPVGRKSGGRGASESSAGKLKQFLISLCCCDARDSILLLSVRKKGRLTAREIREESIVIN